MTIIMVMMMLIMTKSNVEGLIGVIWVECSLRRIMSAAEQPINHQWYSCLFSFRCTPFKGLIRPNGAEVFMCDLQSLNDTLTTPCEHLCEVMARLYTLSAELASPPLSSSGPYCPNQITVTSRAFKPMIKSVFYFPMLSSVVFISDVLCSDSWNFSLRILTRLLEVSDDPQVIAVAAHDVGEYVRHYPRGKRWESSQPPIPQYIWTCARFEFSSMLKCHSVILTVCVFTIHVGNKRETVGGKQ